MFSYLSPTRVGTKIKRLLGRQRSAFQRYPLLFTLLGTFGLVATYYGFEKMIDQVLFLSDRPLIVLTIGIGILIFTGQLYKKLDR